MTVKVLGLKDFMENFVDEHSLTGGDDVLLDVTQEEVEQLGIFFVRGICGWMQGLKKVRQQQQSSFSLESADERGGDGIEESDHLN